MADRDDAFPSFADKWLRDNPEQAIVAVFLAPQERRIARAFGSLVNEFEHAVFAAREPQAAGAKLAWWRGELAAIGAGAGRHPIARELVAAAPERAAAVDWAPIVERALSLLDAPAPASVQSAFDALAAFYRPVAAADAVLHGREPAALDAAADLWSGAQLLRSARALHANGSAAFVPLDLLARHELTRADLARPSAQRARLLRDYLAALELRIGAALASAPATGVGRRVRARLDRTLARHAMRANDPAQFLAHTADARWRTLWVAWREAAARARAAAAGG